MTTATDVRGNENNELVHPTRIMAGKTLQLKPNLTSQAQNPLATVVSSCLTSWVLCLGGAAMIASPWLLGLQLLGIVDSDCAAHTLPYLTLHT